MRFGRWIPAAILLVPAVLMVVPIGCKRSYPITPTAPLTSTFTPAGTSTFTRSATPTVTRTPTATYTRTNTPTMTNTGAATATPSFTFTKTLSPTPTLTNTLTLTPTVTNTSVPPVGIDNLEDGDGTINLLPGVGTAGGWFTASDGTCSTVFPDPAGAFLPSANGAPLAGSLYSAHLTGTGCSTFGAVAGFNFIAPTGGFKTSYDVSAYTGIRFDIRQTGGTVASVRFSMPGGFTEPAATGGYCAANCNGHWGQDLTINSTWQPVTVWMAWMTQPSWAPLGQPFDPWESFGLQWQANAASGQDFGFEVDNIAFVNDSAPPTPTPDCKPIDNIEDGDNQINVVCGRAGFWYSYDDVKNNGGNTVTWPDPAVAPFPQSMPGANGTAYAAHLTAILGSAFASRFTGMGFDFYNPRGQYNLSGFNGMSFYAKEGDTVGAKTAVKAKFPNRDTEPAAGICTNCYDNHRVQLNLTTTWTLYKVDFYNTGVNLFPTQEGWGAPQVPFSPAAVYGVQFQSDTQATGDTFDFWVDEFNFY